MTCRGELVFTGTNRGDTTGSSDGQARGRAGGETCPSPQEPTDPNELGGPLGLAGLLKSHWAAGGNGPDSLTSRRDFKTQAGHALRS